MRGFMGRGLKASEIKLRQGGQYGVLSYDKWLAEGRRVRKGEKSIKGCFHYTQTEEIAKAA
jgi:hypothetical protein